MTDLLSRPAPSDGSFLRRLDGAPIFGNIGPNWFAAAMGTGIVANAAATLPLHSAALMAFAQAVWVLDVVILAAVLGATAMHWRRHPDTARSHLGRPARSQFYGAPAMALMTVGAGAMLVGQDLIGPGPALLVDAVLWSLGTILGLCTAVVVPYRMVTGNRPEPDAAFGGWLMPVVPPMVSAALGPLLIVHLPSGQAQLTALALCYAMFGLTLIVSLVMITMIWSRLINHGIGAAAAVPTLWIVLGPLGQSITAAHSLGTIAPRLLPAPFGAAFEGFGLVYGLPVWGFALLWAALALAITVRTARRRLPFSLTWWSFTFPVGTLVTGTSALAAATGLWLFDAAAVLLYVALVTAWVVVFLRTVRGAWSGLLLRPA